MISGGRIDNFRKGWALHVWNGRRVHYWTRTSIETVQSKCGLEKRALWNTPSGERHSTMYGAGGWPLCSRCK